MSVYGEKEDGAGDRRVAGELRHGTPEQPVGVRLFGRRAGTLAALTLALSAPFVYYSKTANLDVPYVCWFALALLFYLRTLEESLRRVVFGQEEAVHAISEAVRRARSASRASSR